MNSIYKKILACVSVLCMHAAYSTVEWSGTSCPDVTDEDVIINGDCMLPLGDVNIVAENADITIYSEHDTLITPLNPLPDSSETTLYLQVTQPYTITIIVKKHLTFKGFAGLKNAPLSIIIEGTGAVRWLIEEEGKVSFTANDNDGGTELWLYQNFESYPNFSFVMHRKGQVHFGQRSKWGYMLDYCANVEAGTVIEHHHNTFMVFEDQSSFALEAY